MERFFHTAEAEIAGEGRGIYEGENLILAGECGIISAKGAHLNMKPAILRRLAAPFFAAVLLFTAAACAPPGGVSWEDAYNSAAQRAENAEAEGPLDAMMKGMEHGSAMADFALGNEFVEKDPERAVEFYRSAAEYGLPEAQFNLGRMHALGKGVPQNHPEAVKWFRLSADQGFPTAQYNLGVAYAKGRGVEKSHRSAYIWLTLAGIGGHEEEKKRRWRRFPCFPPAPI